MKKEHSAGVVVFSEAMLEGQLKRQYILLCNDKGRWDLPKGQLEEGETPIQAAERELREETGLAVDIIPGFEYTFSYMFRDPQKNLIHKDVTFFLGKAKNTQVTLSFEHADYQWMFLRDALQQASYMNTRQLLSAADQFLDSI
jgi:bis(5'-nucleosidyl)-tetraphosphatase